MYVPYASACECARGDVCVGGAPLRMRVRAYIEGRARVRASTQGQGGRARAGESQNENTPESRRRPMISSSHTLASMRFERAYHTSASSISRDARSWTLSATAAKLRSPVVSTRGAFSSASPSCLRSSFSVFLPSFRSASSPAHRGHRLLAKLNLGTPCSGTK